MKTFDVQADSTSEERVMDAGAVITVVEVTPIGCGRRPDLMRAPSEAGVHVVAATGYHCNAHDPDGHWVDDASVNTLADRIIVDIEHGMHPGDWRDHGAPLDVAWAVGIKAGASYQRISRSERRRLTAAAIGSVRTGAPILTSQSLVPARARGSNAGS